MPRRYFDVKDDYPEFQDVFSSSYKKKGLEKYDRETEVYRDIYYLDICNDVLLCCRQHLLWDPEDGPCSNDFSFVESSSWFVMCDGVWTRTTDKERPPSIGKKHISTRPYFLRKYQSFWTYASLYDLVLETDDDELCVRCEQIGLKELVIDYERILSYRRNTILGCWMSDELDILMSASEYF